jgi:hypothetical protein
MSTMTSREFNQDIGKAKRLARLEPVFVTDRGRPTHVLMSFDAFRQVTGRTESIVDLLAMPEPDAEVVDLDTARGGSWDRREEGF